MYLWCGERAEAEGRARVKRQQGLDLGGIAVTDLETELHSGNNRRMRKEFNVGSNVIWGAFNRWVWLFISNHCWKGEGFQNPLESSPCTRLETQPRRWQ